jgi:hypothetical protein
MATALNTGESARPAVKPRRDDLAIGLVSCVIVAILGLQTFASFVNPGRWGWPFLAYPMYKTAHYEGERILYDVEVYVVREDSSESLMSADGIPFWIFKHKMVDGVMNGKRDSVQPLVTAYCERTGEQVVAVRVQDMGIGLSRDGLVHGLEPETLATMTIGCPE